jgi:hypothetical protein
MVLDCVLTARQDQGNAWAGIKPGTTTKRVAKPMKKS